MFQLHSLVEGLVKNSLNLICYFPASIMNVFKALLMVSLWKLLHLKHILETQIVLATWNQTKQPLHYSILLSKLYNYWVTEKHRVKWLAPIIFNLPQMVKNLLWFVPFLFFHRVELSWILVSLLMYSGQLSRYRKELNYIQEGYECLKTHNLNPPWL